ncbi:MAG: FadR/GntR family transcriptional regulator [Bulleidia sp.]|nr:FadR/GntR family transcriptional regulator [Bulleidia sp.]
MAKKTLAEKTAEDIKAMIQKEGYKPGQKLPTEKELCETLNVGRNTLREAERILQSHNIVYIRQGSGTYISDKGGVPDDPFGLDMVSDRAKLMHDILQMLTIREPQAAGLAAERRTQEDLDKMERTLRGMQIKIDSGSIPIEEECEFYRDIAHASSNIIFERMSPIMTQGIRLFATTLRPLDFQYGVRNYRSVYTAIKAQKYTDAHNAMMYHLLFLGRQYQMLVHYDNIN